MKTLTTQQQQLVEKYMWVPQVAYKKLRWFEDLTPYKDELISEGYYALCVASTYYCEEVKNDAFSYFFRSAVHRMYDYLKEFIYPHLNNVSLDEPIDEDNELYLIDILSDNNGEVNLDSLIDDMIRDFKNTIICNKKLATKTRNNLLSEGSMTRTKHILTMLSQGYEGPEIGITLGISKQCVNQHLQRIRNVLKCGAYRDS